MMIKSKNSKIFLSKLLKKVFLITKGSNPHTTIYIINLLITVVMVIVFSNLSPSSNYP